MESLSSIIKENETWLMGRILSYAKQQKYTLYTSTLKEAWRLSIVGLSASILEAIELYKDSPELMPEEDLTTDPIAGFGILEARRHKERGVSLAMFLGLMKYYRQSYIDLVRKQNFGEIREHRYEHFITRVFDRIEIGFCVEWTGIRQNKAMEELQIKNRLMTNEKNKYLTLFESHPNPIIILDEKETINTMNHAAAKLFKTASVPGSQYYSIQKRKSMEAAGKPDESSALEDDERFIGLNIVTLLPWLKDELNRFSASGSITKTFEKKILSKKASSHFRIKLSRNLDISEKFIGTLVILEDITLLKKTLKEVNTLKGFIPICSNCKNIRNDQGFWEGVENYIEDHSDALFSHGMCPECMEKFYKDEGWYQKMKSEEGGPTGATGEALED